jgi:hypothetical protein
MWRHYEESGGLKVSGLTEREIGFLEGVLDSEGYIGLTKYRSRGIAYYAGCRYVPIVFVSNTNLGFLEKVRELSGGNGSIIPLKSLAAQYPKRKLIYTWKMVRSVMRSVLSQLQLIVKEEQRLLLIDALGILEEKKYKHLTQYDIIRLDTIYQDMKRLNKRGK